MRRIIGARELLRSTQYTRALLRPMGARDRFLFFFISSSLCEQCKSSKQLIIPFRNNGSSRALGFKFVERGPKKYYPLWVRARVPLSLLRWCGVYRYVQGASLAPYRIALNFHLTRHLTRMCLRAVNSCRRRHRCCCWSPVSYIKCNAYIYAWVCSLVSFSLAPWCVYIGICKAAALVFFGVRVRCLLSLLALSRLLRDMAQRRNPVGSFLRGLILFIVFLLIWIITLFWELW